MFAPSDNESADLPTGQTVVIEFMPTAPWEFSLSRPMGTFCGRFIVE